jgi:hypothetical protein
MRLFESLKFIGRDAPPTADTDRRDASGCTQRPNRLWRQLELRCGLFGRQKGTVANEDDAVVVKRRSGCR